MTLCIISWPFLLYLGSQQTKAIKCRWKTESNTQHHCNINFSCSLVFYHFLLCQIVLEAPEKQCLFPETSPPAASFMRCNVILFFLSKCMEKAEKCSFQHFKSYFICTSWRVAVKKISSVELLANPETLFNSSLRGTGILSWGLGLH